jgi:hypothetical protein
MFTPNQTKKRILIVIVLLVLILLVSILIKNIKLSDSYSFSGSNITESPDIELSEAVPLLENQNNIPIDSLSEKTLSYGEVIDLYGQKRIQIDKDCRATPTAASFTVGTTIVIDNRSEEVKAVKFIEDTYAIPPLHVKIFELNRQGIFAVDCGSSKNVSIIRVN